MPDYLSEKRGYEGGAYHSELERGRAFGRIGLTPAGITFFGSDVQRSLPTKGIEIRAGGANDHTIFFTHPDVPGWTLFTGDRKILEELNLSGSAEIFRQVGDIRKKSRKAIWGLAALLMMMVVGIYGLFLLKEPLCIAIAHRVPPSWEEKIGKMAFSQLEARERFMDDPAVEKQIEKIARPIIESIGSARYEFTIAVADNSQINAFALPGGYIVFNSGLLIAAKSPEEIAGVMAHEMAHVTLQHGMRQMISSLGIFAVIQAFFGDASGILAVMADNAAFLLTQKYSRDYEREADEAGWEYLVGASVNPTGMIEFFDTLLEEQKKETALMKGEALNFLSTHPTTEERIERLREKRDDMEGAMVYFDFDVDFGAFQAAVKHQQKVFP